MLQLGIKLILFGRQGRGLHFKRFLVGGKLQFGTLKLRGFVFQAGRGNLGVRFDFIQFLFAALQLGFGFFVRRLDFRDGEGFGFETDPFRFEFLFQRGETRLFRRNFAFAAFRVLILAVELCVALGGLFFLGRAGFAKRLLFRFQALPGLLQFALPFFQFGFRLALGGASEFFGLKPDLVTFAKALGNGAGARAITRGRRPV